MPYIADEVDARGPWAVFGSWALGLYGQIGAALALLGLITLAGWALIHHFGPPDRGFVTFVGLWWLTGIAGVWLGTAWWLWPPDLRPLAPGAVLWHAALSVVLLEFLVWFVYFFLLEGRNVGIAGLYMGVSLWVFSTLGGAGDVIEAFRLPADVLFTELLAGGLWITVGGSVALYFLGG